MEFRSLDSRLETLRSKSIGSAPVSGDPDSGVIGVVGMAAFLVKGAG